jgi:signal transduction histidine kinase
VVRRGDRVLARLEHRASVAERVRAGLTPAVVMALENDLLVATAANELEELRRLRSDIVRRIDAERRKLERDLHDGAQQRLLALGLRMGALAERQGSGTPLALAADHAGAALAQLRRLAHGVIPSVLDDDGLYEALLSIVDDGGPEVHLLVEPLAGRRFAPDVERAAFLVVFNSLRDARHSASPTFEVEASTDGGLSIETSHVGWSIGHRDEDEDRVGAAGGTFSAAVSDGVVVCGASFR